MINGLSAGRPLIEYTLATAFGSSEDAPRPYTVSVGKATVRDARKWPAAVSRCGRKDVGMVNVGLCKGLDNDEDDTRTMSLCSRQDKMGVLDAMAENRLAVNGLSCRMAY